MENNPEQLFKNINLEPNVIKNTLANLKVTQALLEVIRESGISKAEKKIGNWLFL